MLLRYLFWASVAINQLSINYFQFFAFRFPVPRLFRVLMGLWLAFFGGMALFPTAGVEVYCYPVLAGISLVIYLRNLTFAFRQRLADTWMIAVASGAQLVFIFRDFVALARTDLSLSFIRSSDTVLDLIIIVAFSTHIARLSARANTRLKREMLKTEELSEQMLMQELEKQRIIKQQNEELADRVTKRTAELQMVNEELKTANDEITRQIELQAEQSREIEYANSQLQQSYENLRLLSTIGQKITASLDLKLIGKSIFDNMNALMDAPVIVICTYDEKQHLLDYSYVLEEGEYAPQVLVSTTEHPELPAVQCVVQGREVVVQEGQVAVITGKEVQSLVYIPLRVEDTIIGAFSIQSFRSNAYSEYDISIMRAIAPYIASALSNVKAFERVHEKTRELEVLETIVRSINQAPTMDTLLQRLVEAAIQLVPTADSGSMFVLDAKKNVFRVAAGVGFDEREIHALEFDKEAFIEDWHTNGIRVAPNIYLRRFPRRFEDSPGSNPTTSEHPESSLPPDTLLAPLRGSYSHSTPACTIGMFIENSAQTDGVLFLDNSDNPNAFSADDGNKLALLREHLITAFTKLRTIEELSAQRIELETIDKIVRTVNTETSLQTMLQSVLEFMLPLFPKAEKTSIFMLDTEAQKFRFVAAIGYEWSVLQSIVISLEEANDRWMRSGKVFILREFYGVDESSQFAGFAPPLVALCMPVVVEGSLQGGIFFDNFTDTEAFNEGDIERLNSIRQHIAAAFAKIITIQKLEERNTALFEANRHIEIQAHFQSEQTRLIQSRNTELHESLETLRRTQTQLVQAEKMASLGTLVAGVAHELNTPIGVAVTASSTLKVRTDAFAKRYAEGGLKKSELEAYVKTAQIGADLTMRNLERAADLIQSFKRVAVDQTSDSKRTFNLGQYLHEIATSLQPMLKGTQHQIFIDCRSDIDIESYPGAFAQIVTNFVQNSVKHGFEGFTNEGIMHIAVRRTDEAIRLEYRDNGSGIPENILPRIFDPFFTTKPGEQGGTGLGLNVVYNLVTQKLRGEMHVESKEGEGSGTNFFLTIPRF